MQCNGNEIHVQVVILYELSHVLPVPHLIKNIFSNNNRALSLKIYLANCILCLLSGLPDLALSLLDWLLKYCRLPLICSGYKITFDLCEVWLSPELGPAWCKRAVDTKCCPSATKNIVDTFTFLIAKTSSSLLGACFISPEDINFAASTTIHKRGILRLLHSWGCWAKITNKLKSWDQPS